MGRTLRDAGIVQSMSSVGDPYDNAACESWVGTVKRELIHRHAFTTRDQARLAMFDYIEGFYNPRRRHSSLGYASPDAYERHYWSSQHDAQKTQPAGADLSPSQQAGKAPPLAQTGPCGPGEAGQPALPKGAPAGLETLTQEAAA